MKLGTSCKDFCQLILLYYLIFYLVFFSEQQTIVTLRRIPLNTLKNIQKADKFYLWFSKEIIFQ